MLFQNYFMILLLILLIRIQCKRRRAHFKEKLDRVVSTHLLTIEDDPTDAKSLAAANFDREGVPHGLTNIIDEGILKTFLYNTYTAGKDQGREYWKCCRRTKYTTCSIVNKSSN